MEESEFKSKLEELEELTDSQYEICEKPDQKIFEELLDDAIQKQE